MMKIDMILSEDEMNQPGAPLGPGQARHYPSEKVWKQRGVRILKKTDM